MENQFSYIFAFYNTLINKMSCCLHTFEAMLVRSYWSASCPNVQIHGPPMHIFSSKLFVH